MSVEAKVLFQGLFKFPTSCGVQHPETTTQSITAVVPPFTASTAAFSTPSNALTVSTFLAKIFPPAAAFAIPA